MDLIIVESPTKAKTISKFLGSKYRVLSSYGHIRDLPKSELGVDTEHNFEPKYIIPTKARKTASMLKKEAKEAKRIILATDEDREGEAIAFHLAHILDLDNKEHQRIVFHEITKQAIENALKNPRDIDMNLVNAQQARRILDRLVGYKLSPFLWKKIVKGLSAGRVQSVAVRFIVEREEEIKAFKPQEYYTIEAELQAREANAKTKFLSLLVKKDNKVIPKLGIDTKKEADGIIKDLNRAEYKVANIDKKESKRNPLPPFTTSFLQQEASKRLRWPAKFTMSVAQKLYEKGHITYHRTDSLNLSEISLASAKKFIEKKYGKNYFPGFARRFKTKSKGAQEAHEAIRPTYPDKEPDKLKLDDKQYRLYDLIWRRFIASQMSQAIFDSTSIDISAKNYIFRTTGQTLKFDGFLKVYNMKYEEAELPVLEKDKILELIKLLSNQHFTQPPPRYTEAGLIKILEENGIGRPSTYAPTISTIQARNYVQTKGLNQLK
jgi:DNA topoisomerase-1